MSEFPFSRLILGTLDLIMRLLLSSLFPLLFLAVSVLASCPSEESVSPCKCENQEDYVDLNCYIKSITLDQVKSALQALDRNDPVVLFFGDMNLGSIPSNFFQGFNIRKLEIYKSSLDSLSSDGGKALTGLEDTLVGLEIMSSFTEKKGLTKLDLGHLRKLKEIDIGYNAITELADDWFAGGPASLTFILFTNNNIEKVGDNAFANVSNLEAFHFDGNRFGSLKRSMLPNPASRLEELEIENNDFTSLPEDLFANMPALKRIVLSTNRLTHIPEQTFKPVWNQVNVVDLRGNPIVCDSHLDWIRKLKSKTAVLGRCGSPRGKRGVELQDFLGL